MKSGTELEWDENFAMSRETESIKPTTPGSELGTRNSQLATLHQPGLIK